MQRYEGSGDALLSISLNFYAIANRYMCNKTTTSPQLHSAYLLNWSSSDLVLNVTVGVYRLAGQTGFVFLSSCMSVNLPSCHRAAFPPLFAQLIPFPYKECEGSNITEKNAKETTAFLPLMIYPKKAMKQSCVIMAFIFLKKKYHIL